MKFTTKLKKCWRILTEKPQKHEDNPTAERKAQRKDAEKYIKLLRNIEVYDGTDKNQMKIY